MLCRSWVRSASSVAAKPAYSCNKHSCLLPSDVRGDRDAVQDGSRVKMGRQEHRESDSTDKRGATRGIKKRIRGDGCKEERSTMRKKCGATGGYFNIIKHPV